jgi:urea transport system ATP-binding protein
MLKVSGLNQYYGGSHILRDLAFEVPAGQVTTLLGRNGVGKTTLLRTLMGVVPAATGSIRFGDAELTGSPPYQRVRRGIGYVPQGREIFARLTVEENLQMGLASKPRSARIPERIFEMFPVLKSMLRRRGGDLSGGQQQQLAIGRALAMSPQLLILDEPTEGIQPSIIKDIERVIRSLTDRQVIEDAIRTVAATGEVAILLVEQYYDFARSLADHYLVMERGEIIARGAGEHMDRDGVRGMLAV